MTVGQLIDRLHLVEDKDRIVILQKDSEGNGFSPLEGADENAVWQPYNAYSGEVKLQYLIAGFDEEDVGDGESCLVLYPVN